MVAVVVADTVDTIEDGEVTEGVSSSKSSRSRGGDGDEFSCLKKDHEIARWALESKSFIEKLLTAPDPILAVQKQRKNDKHFISIAVKILALLQSSSFS
jgi:hypothetical protein